MKTIHISKITTCALRTPYLLCLLAVAFFITPAAFANNASPEAVELKQSDGTLIRLFPKGDEFSNWFEDENHYAVVLNKGQYVYATLDTRGQLAPTGWLVGRVDPAAAGLKQGLKPSPDAQRKSRINALPPQLRLGAEASTGSVGEPPSGVNAQGTVKNLVILCKFSDHDSTKTRTVADFNKILNAVGGDLVLAPTGSVRDYYTEASYGTVTIQSTVLAWVTLPHPESYYGAGKNGTGAPYPNNGQGMVEDALKLVDPLVDFGNFDTDKDGFIDAIDIIHSGYAAETGGGAGNWMWSHKWSLWAVPGGKWTSNDKNANGVPVKVYDYHTEAALWGTSGKDITRIGVIAHETGHFFGLPDLYDVDNSSAGIGSYCLMANSWGFDGSQRHPPHFSAWCRKELKFVTPEVITAGNFSLPKAETSTKVYKITAGYGANEYLLIENRQPFGFESDMPQGGLAIWHIDESKLDNKSEGFPGQTGWPQNNNHYRVALLQADGKYDMEHNRNRGDAGDLYSLATKSSITPSTVPSTDRYQSGTVGSTSHFIKDISASGATMTFTLAASGGGGGGDKPNLTPYQPAGWSGKIVVAKTIGTVVDSNSYRASDTLYVDWAVANFGTVNINVGFKTKLLVDGVLKATWSAPPPTESNHYRGVADYNIGKLSAGTHKLRIVADSGNAVDESNETDNAYTKTIFVSQ